MKIIFNGQTLDLAENSTLLNLIESQNLIGKRLAAEVNLEIIPKTEHANYILKNDDKVEIVHAIGGG
jgi:sulfur carrier protein